MKQGHTFIYSLLKFEIFSSIHCIYIATKHETVVHMKNAICQYILPYYHLSIHLFDQIKKRFLVNLIVAVAEVSMSAR
jgi:hypothetical protein